jgi:hypothetical protein
MCEKIVRIISILATLVFLVACNQVDYQVVTLNKNGVLFEAKFGNIEEKIINNKVSVGGMLSISNQSNVPVKYSNRDLHLIIEGEGKSRTYLDSVASHVVDFSYIEIPPNKTEYFKVYWVYPEVKLFKIKKIRLEWNQ